jgi:hypothetical protein
MMQINDESVFSIQGSILGDVDTLVDTGLKRMGEAIASISEDDLQRDDFYPWEQGVPLWREIVGNIYSHSSVSTYRMAYKKRKSGSCG